MIYTNEENTKLQQNAIVILHLKVASSRSLMQTRAGEAVGAKGFSDPAYS